MKAISTIHPLSPFLADVVGHPVISGVRLNTVMPMRRPLEEGLLRLKKAVGEKDIWIDLKCRQIRTSHGFFFDAPERPRKIVVGDTTFSLDPSCPRTHGVIKTPPWAELTITHKIKLDLSKGPVKCYMQDGYDSAYIADIIDGNRLIMLDGPKRVVGGGESINILDPSLEIEGYLTETDREFIEAAKKVGIHTYMLSYVEQDSDISDLFDLDPDAKVLAKIESRKGITWATESFPKKFATNPQVSLMAARGDLYVEIGIDRPDNIIKATRKIIKADPQAILASRILTSLRQSSRPTCSDITDIECSRLMGYKTLMIGDDICFDKGPLMLALDILKAID
ncbi:MAG TPA: pyruvate kinase [Candidatus Magasanikbacteria bacterium]|nr:pyruvate kinase [Candidatus Magasanikbacteria bacterium]